jgi:hypothetical protein
MESQISGVDARRLRLILPMIRSIATTTRLRPTVQEEGRPETRFVTPSYVLTAHMPDRYIMESAYAMPLFRNGLPDVLVSAIDVVEVHSTPKGY